MDPTTIYFLANVAIFPCVIALVLLHVHTDPAALQSLGEPSPVPLWHVTQVAFITSLILDFISWLWTVDKDRARLFRLVLIINGAPVVSYSLLTYNLAPLMVDIHGRRLVMIRYVHWLFTTPAMVFLYSKVSCISNSELMFAMVMEFTCIATGFLASTMPFPFDLINLAISCTTFYFVMTALNKMLSIAIRFGHHAARIPRAISG